MCFFLVLSYARFGQTAWAQPAFQEPQIVHVPTPPVVLCRGSADKPSETCRKSTQHPMLLVLVSQPLEIGSSYLASSAQGIGDQVLMHVIT